MSGCPAYFITWTTYGQWLHGDDRGSVDLDHNQPGTPELPPSTPRVAFERDELAHPPMLLSLGERVVVDQTIRDHLAFRKWTLHAVSVRSNHVHLVVGAPVVAPEDVMGQCKAWSSRRLREHGFIAPGSKVWTHHGSTRYLWNGEGLVQAVDYVTRLQDHPARFAK